MDAPLAMPLAGTNQRRADSTDPLTQQAASNRRGNRVLQYTRGATMIVTEAVIPEPADSVAEPTVESKSKDVTELVKTTFFFEMGFKNIGEERKAPGTEQDIKTTANKALLKVKKRLFVSPEFQKIKSVDAQFKRLVGKLCVRGGLLTVRTIPKHRAKLILSMC